MSASCYQLGISSRLVGDAESVELHCGGPYAATAVRECRRRTCRELRIYAPLSSLILGPRPGELIGLCSRIGPRPESQAAMSLDTELSIFQLLPSRMPPISGLKPLRMIDKNRRPGLSVLQCRSFNSIRNLQLAWGGKDTRARELVWVQL